MTSPEKTLGIIAGGGRFPFLLAREARARGYRTAAVAFRNNTDPGLESDVDSFREIGLGKLGALIGFFRKSGVTHVVMGGTINKAGAMDVIPDLRAARVLMRLPGKGDDALLRALAEELEREGMAVLKAHELIPELLTPAGVLTRKKPSAAMREDIEFGWPAAKSLGSLDIGQTIVVRKQVIAAVEALEGTNEAIRRGCALAGSGCTVIKVFKPGQEERVDMPSIGLATLEIMAECGASCLCVEAGRSLFFDREEALRAADRSGICVVGYTENEART